MLGSSLGDLDAVDVEGERAAPTDTQLRLYPEVFRLVVADGHEIGLHGADLRRVDHIPEAEFSRGQVESKDMLEQAIQRPVVWYRPPYGRLTFSAWTAVTNVGMATAGWTCDIQDWLI